MAFRLVVLASGSGTNLQAILDTLHGREGIEVVGVASDKRGARALERGRDAGVETAVFPRDEYAGRDARDAAIAEWIEARGADLVVLAGYMQLLSPAFVARFRGRVVNIHPALLPAFPGLDAIGQALDGGGRDDRGDGALTSTRASTPGRRSCSARCRCPPTATGRGWRRRSTRSSTSSTRRRSA